MLVKILIKIVKILALIYLKMHVYLLMIRMQRNLQKLFIMMKEIILFLILDNNFPLGKWTYTEVIKNFPEIDGLFRVVNLKTGTTELSRPISKLILLTKNIDDLFKV